MNCETNDCRKEKRGCKGCYYDELQEDLIEHEKTSFEFQELYIKTKSELETYKKANDNLLVKNAELKQDVQESKKALNDENLRCSFYAIENNDLKEKLEIQANLTETYKKIAEKLAELLYRGDETDYICDLILGEHCVKYETGKCNQCIIDWARKEVEKDV